MTSHQPPAGQPESGAGPAAPDLPPFSQDTECPKCLGKDVTIAYHPGHRKFRPCQDQPGIGGHLCRACQRCGYGWCEAPADAQA